MSRGASGFRTGAVYCLAANVVMFGAFLRIDSPTVCVATWWVVNFPSIPLLWALAQFFPPPTGEAEVIRWDYCMWVAGALFAAGFWGVFGALVARLTARRAGTDLIADLD